MAKSGRPLKLPEERRNHVAPLRGEWVDLPSEGRTAPALSNRGKGRGKWSPRTQKAWRAWWADPVSTQWGRADCEFAELTVDLYEEWVRRSLPSNFAQLQRALDALGLTPRGRQDRRWRVKDAEAAATQPHQEGGGKSLIAHLRVVK